jgi:Mn2+/Fe2+ NRAMP family transporter
MNKIVEFFRSIGPAIIAAVVCGPGSILMSSKTGAIYGYQMIWVLALFIGMSIAIVSIAKGCSVVNVITVAQASTVLGLPALAAALIYLTTRPDLTGERKVPQCRTSS